MRFGNIIFGLFTALILFGFVGKIKSPTPYPETFDDRVKLTSLVSAAGVMERPPILIPPLITEKKEVGERATGVISKVSVLAEPQISARAAAILRLGDGAVLLNFNARGRHPLASLTKLMTAVIAAEKMGLARGVTISEEDVWQEGDVGNFTEGEVWSVADLIGAILTVSSNDAAHALARVYGERNFIDAMQEKASDLRMQDTSFADATGITSLNQSTVEDIGKLIHYINDKHPEFLRLSSQEELNVKEINSGHIRQLKNINKFAGRAYFLGGKTGYTEEAGGNLVSIFSLGSEKMVIIILGAATPDARFTESEKLYEWLKNMVQ